MPTIIDPAPSNSRAIAVRTGQQVRLVADSSSDWYQRTDGIGVFTRITTAGSPATSIVWTANPSIFRRFTFTRVEIAVVTPMAAVPTSANLLVNVSEGPVSVLHATNQIRNEAMEEPPLHSDMLETDDEPLGLPLAMPGASREGMGTVALDRAREPGGPANLVSLYGPGMFVDTSGRLGVRTPIGVLRGLGPFPTSIASYHYGAFYYNYDFGKSRTLTLQRFLREDFGLDKDVVVLRGDGRRNTYRYFNYNAASQVAYYTPAAGLQNTLRRRGTFFQETTPSGTYYVYNAGGSLPGRLDRVIDRYGNTVYYQYASNKLIKVSGPVGSPTSGMVAYLRYDANGFCNALLLEDGATPANNRTSYFEYDANRNLIKITGPELCVTYFEYGTGTPTMEFLTAATDSLNQRWRVGYDTTTTYYRVNAIADPKGQAAYFAYDATNAITRWRDRVGKTTYFHFNAYGSPTAVTNVGTPCDYFRYDGDGNLTSTETRLGKNWYYQYDSLGNRIAVNDPLGARSYFVYDSKYQLLSFTDPLLHKTYLAYDANRNRTLQIDPIGNTAYFAYQTSGLLNYKKDRRGAFTYLVFDAKANLTAVKDPLALTTYHNYNSAGERTQTIDPLSRTSHFSFDKRGRLTQTTNALGETSYFAYDVACNPVVEVDPRNTSTYHTYDQNYDRTKTVVAMGGGTFLFTYFGYDAEDRLTSRKDARLNQTTWSYDALGRRQNQTDPFGGVRYTAYDVAHETLLTLDENGNATYYDYDPTGRLAHTVDALLKAEYYGYDLHGNRVRVIDKRGNATTFTYDARELLQNTTNAIGAVTYNAYDQEQNRILTLDPLLNPAYFNYDLRGLLTNTRDAFGSFVYFEYDGARQQTRRLEPPLNGSSILAATYFTYDLAGRQQTVKDAHLNQSYMAYDRGGNLILTTNQRYATTPTAFQYFKYDAASRQIESDDLGELATYHVYDLVGNRTAVYEEQGFGRQPWGTSPYGGERVARYFEYDALNRLTNTISASSVYSTTVSFTYHGYDKASNRVQTRVENPKGGADIRYSYFEYDRLNRMVKSLDPNATTSGGAAGVTYHGYDENSNRITVVDQEGRPTYMTYDVINRQQNQLNAFLNTTYMVYDTRNALKRRIDPMGRAVYHDYDALNRMIRQSNALGQVSYFGYDRRSNRVLSQNPRGFSTYFTYDLLGRMTHQKDALNGVRYFGFDEVGNKILEVDERFGWTYFAYDQANRTRMVMDQGDSSGVRGQTYFGWDAVGSLTQRLDADGRMTYLVYDASRRNTSQSYTTPVVGETAEPTWILGFDSVGNLATTFDQTGLFTQDFDKLNRLVKKTTQAGSVYYEYDKAGVKSRLKDTDLTESYYGYDRASRLAFVELLDGSVRRTYYAYDASGMASMKVLPNAAGTSFSVCSYYRYDSAGRLLQFDNRIPPSNAILTYFAYETNANGGIERILHEDGGYTYYVYDALDRMTRDVRFSSGGTMIYGFYYNYDGCSNRYFKYDAAGGPDASNKTTYYLFDPRNVMTKETRTT